MNKKISSELDFKNWNKFIMIHSACDTRAVEYSNEMSNGKGEKPPYLFTLWCTPFQRFNSIDSNIV